MTPTERDEYLEFQARRAAWIAHIDRLFTEPLKVREFAELFGVPDKNMRAILDNLKRRGLAERLNRSTWRVALSSMPPSYHVAAGLFPQDAPPSRAA